MNRATRLLMFKGGTGYNPIGRFSEDIDFGLDDIH